MDSPNTTAVQVSATTEVHFNGFADLAAERGRRHKSTEFMCLGHRWKISIYPGGNDEAKEGMVSLFLCHISDESINIEYKIIVKNCPESAWYKDNFAHNKGRGFSNFATRSDVLESLEDGALVIEVAMKLVDPTKQPSHFIPVNPSACEVIQRMFLDEGSADVLIEVRGRQFHAHRNILQQCSIILADLCESARDQNAPIQISDVSPGVFRHLLYYMYGGKVLDYVFKSYGKELIDAADKYGVINLKLEAEVRFVEATTFAMDNVMDHLLYAESKNCAFIKESVMDFIAENKIEALKKISFKDAPGNFMGDILAAVAREDRKSTTDGDSEGELIRMRISELRKKAHLKGLNVDGSREMLIASLEKQKS